MKNTEKKVQIKIADTILHDMSTEFKNLWDQYNSKTIKYYQYSKLCDDVYIRWNVSKEAFHSQVGKIISQNA